MEEEKDDDNDGKQLKSDGMEEENNPKDNSFKEKILGILEEINFKDKRSSKLDIDDFLKVLHTFNQHEIHFK